MMALDMRAKGLIDILMKLSGKILELVSSILSKLHTRSQKITRAITLTWLDWKLNRERIRLSKDRIGFLEGRIVELHSLLKQEQDNAKRILEIISPDASEYGIRNSEEEVGKTGNKVTYKQIRRLSRSDFRRLSREYERRTEDIRMRKARLSVPISSFVERNIERNSER